MLAATGTYVLVQWEELFAGLEAYTKENKALHLSIEQSKQELSAAEEDEQKFKQAFLHACSQLNAKFRCCSASTQNWFSPQPAWLS